MGINSITGIDYDLQLIAGINGQPIGLDYKLLLFDEIFEKEQEEVRKKKQVKKNG